MITSIYVLVVSFAINQVDAITCYPTSSSGACKVLCRANDTSSYQECKNTFFDCPEGLSCEIHCSGYSAHRRRLWNVPSVKPTPSASNTLPIQPQKHDIIAKEMVNEEDAQSAAKMVVKTQVPSFAAHSRKLQSIYRCPSNISSGCCGSTLTCADGEYCFIDCEDGCNGVTINGTTAAHLDVFGCGHTNGANNCGNMEIYCPRNGRAGNRSTCWINGDGVEYDIENSNIYTGEGFRDVTFDYIEVVCNS